MSDKIINFDFEGWPEKAMSIRDIIESFGGVYNKETNNWEIPESKKLDITPIVLEDDGQGYGVNEQYLIQGSFIDDQYNFFRDKELDYIDIWKSSNVYPGEIVKDLNGKEWILIDVDDFGDGIVFRAYEFNIDKIIEKTQDICIFTIEQVKQMK